MKMNLIKIVRTNLGFIAGLTILELLFISIDAKTFALKPGLYSPHEDTPANNIAIETTSLNLTFKSVDGKIINLTEQKGKVVFINFWATWCSPCRAEMPSINSLYEKVRKEDKVVFLMVDADNKLAAANKFMKRRSFQLPVFGAVSAIPEQIFSGALPTTLIIDPNGKIVFQHSGMADYDRPEVLNFINAMLID